MESISNLSSKCRICPNVGKCDRKRMEACAYFEGKNIAEAYAMPGGVEVSAHILREMQEIYINGEKIIKPKEEIEKALYGHLYDCLYGA